MHHITCRCFHWRWVYAVSKREITFALLCGFFLLLVCVETGTLFCFLIYYMLIAVTVGKGLSSGSFTFVLCKIIAYLLLSCVFSLARLSVRYSFLSDKSIHWRIFRMEMTKWLEMFKIAVRSSIRVLFRILYPMQAPGCCNLQPFLFTWYPYCRKSLLPAPPFKNWIQTVRLTCLSWSLVVNTNPSLPARTQLSTDLFVYA